MFLIRSSTRGRERGGEGKGGEGEIQFFPAHCPREPGTGRKRYRAVLEGRKRVFQLSNRIRLFLLSRLSNRSKKISIERERKRIDRIESVGGRKGGGRKGKRWKGFSFDEIESRPFYFFLQTPNLFSPSIPSPVAVFTSPTDSVQRMGTIRFLSGEHPDAIQFRSLHHHCSRLSKIYPIVATVPSPRLRRYIAHRYPAALFENPRGSRIKNPKLLACHIRVIVCL